MHSLLVSLLVLHITSGFTALVTGGLASFTKKGSAAHRRSGKWYVGAMTGVFVTAVVISVLKNLVFLFMIGFFSYYFVVRGYRLLYLKGLGRTQKARALDWFITTSAFLFGLGLLIYAGSLYTHQNSFWPVPLAFGLISCSFALADARLYRKGSANKQHWLLGHIVSMGAGYIATWTAFAVTNVNFLPPVLVWLAPSLIGSILISRSTRRYRKPAGAELLMKTKEPKSATA